MADETKTNDNLSEVAKKEEGILQFWQENKIFEKSTRHDSKEEFVFYDGPPFATGTPHYGHIVAGTIKDVIPRYQTMKGKYVKRRWGWDCHGLPVENLIEKELNLQTKKDIEEYGIGNFNAKARASVLRYVDYWKMFVPRLGRFIDMENDYKTLNATYSESVWWIFKTLYDKGLIYEGYKSMHICPRCETTLSNFEVTQGYQDITDLSVTVKFELVGEPGTYILAWTTTPWTLPGNVALAINPDIDYVKIRLIKENAGPVAIEAKPAYDINEIEAEAAKPIPSAKEDYFILAKDRLGANIKDKYEIVDTFRGDVLVGKGYKPAFPYYQDGKLENFANGWKIYPASFVTTEDGTGVVHIAPAFGEDDMNLGKEKNLPFVQHVGMNGVFKPEVVDFPGLSVKPKGHHQDTDIEVLKYLAGKSILFAKEKITHSYPHCWRCQTPLLNYATTSWFVKVTDIKDQLVENNKTVSWVPDHIKDGRFGKWLEGARDWAISRSRYWGAPIPVWRCDKCGEDKVVGAVADLKECKGNHKNKYILMRHGEAECNLNDAMSCHVTNGHHLTEKGKGEVGTTAQNLKEKKIDVIIASDFLRTKETAELVAETIGYDKSKIIFDARLRELNTGKFDGGKWADYVGHFASKRDRLLEVPEEGESAYQLKQRAGEFLYDINQKYVGQNILIVSHGITLFFLQAAARGWGIEEALRSKDWGSSFATAESKELEFYPLPHNENYELDLHRPYIDNVELSCTCGGTVKRIPDVFDCWFESGSMPYGEMHYPFENTDIFDPAKDKGFPADFIAEGLDQTRGWFYSMLVLSTALFGKTSYKNVIVNGMVLAEDGQKMSKSLKNFPDPKEVVDKYGADALRFYLLSSPVVRAEELNFSEKGVGEVYRKVIMRLSNVLSFYEMYTKDVEVKLASNGSANILDIWILARLHKLMTEIDKAMDSYEIDKTLRSIDEFIDDLSNWYLRRSRDRFKSEDQADKLAAMQITKFVLRETAKIVAPFTPFIAEEIYQKLKEEGDKESVHLEEWPKEYPYDEAALDNMTKARKVVEIGLNLRDQALIKVRQPLARITLTRANDLPDAFRAVVADEINVKEVVVGDVPAEVLDTNITESLREEGEVREIVRLIQDLRKKKGLNPGDPIKLRVVANDGGRNLLEKFGEEIKKLTGATTLEVEAGVGESKIGESTFSFEIM